MPVQDKVAAIEFTQDTGLEPAAIREAGRRAAESGRRFLSSAISEAGANDSSIKYLAKGPGGIVEQMAMIVRWEEIGGGRRRVQFSVGDYITLQSKVFLFIPSGPKTAPALKSAERFAEAFRAELAA